MSIAITIAPKLFQSCQFAAFIALFTLIIHDGSAGEESSHRAPGKSPACAATLIAGTTGVITTNVSASRAGTGMGDATTGINAVTGVGPLSVFFTASTVEYVGGTPTVVGSNAPSKTRRPFHELHYGWDFGDASAGNWRNGNAASRNAATGPVTAHVFETPGLHVVKLRVSDGANIVENACTQVTVQNPDAVFAGTKTICIAADSTPTAGAGGCPAHALTLGPQRDFPSIIANYAKTGRRILLKAGDIFTGSATAVLGTEGPGIIGTYSNPSKPNVPGAMATARIRSSDTAGAAACPRGGCNLLTVSGARDWRLMDLEFDGCGSGVHSGHSSVGVTCGGGPAHFATTPSCPGGDGSGDGNQQAIDGGPLINQLTLLRLNIHDIGGAIELPLKPAVTARDQITLADSTVQRLNDVTSNSHGILAAGSRIAILGNLFDDSTGNLAEHMIRIQFMDRGVVSSNTIRNVPICKEMLSLRAPTATDAGPGKTSGFFPYLAGDDAATRNVVISDNNIQVSSYAGIHLTQVKTPDDTRIHDVILERNFYQNKADGALFNSAGLSSTALIVHGKDVTIRNEIIDVSNDVLKGHNGIVIEGATGEPASSGIDIHHNTIYSGSGGNFVGIGVYPGTSAITVRNNLGYRPNQSDRPPMLRGTPTSAANNSGDAGQPMLATDPLFVGPLTARAGFALRKGSPYIDRGVVVPVFSDAFGNARPRGNKYDGNKHDIGASEN